MIEHVATLFEAQNSVDEPRKWLAAVIENPPILYDKPSRPLLNPKPIKFTFPAVGFLNDRIATNPERHRFFSCDENSIYVLRAISK